MNNSGAFAQKWKEVCGKVRGATNKCAEFLSPVTRFFGKVGKVFTFVGTWIYRLRKIILMIPVMYGAIRLAAYNSEHLPESVGIMLQSTGEYAQMITRNQAVFAPFVVTAACLLLMLCSRKTLYPWIISLFSLALPILILFTNVYPA